MTQKQFSLLIWLAILALIVGCNPSKKAHQFANSNPKEFADFCATQFPAKDSSYAIDSISFDTLYLERMPQIETNYYHDTVFRTVYFPGTTQFVTKTIRKDSTIIRIDQAAVQAKQNQIDNLIVNNKDLVGQRDQAKKGRNWWRIIALSLITFNVIKTVWKLWLSKYNIGKLFNLK